MKRKNPHTSDMIADYSNNRLNPEEKAEFEELLGKDQALADELNDFEEFKQLYREIDPVEPSPSESVFAQVSSNIGELGRKRKTSPAMSSRLTELISDFWQQLRESMTVPWMLAAAQTVVIVLLLMPVTQQNSYTTLSSSNSSAIVEKIGINVVFRPNALESDIRNLLLEIEATVTSGPSSEGRYVINIDNESDRSNVVQTLQQSEFVLFAEPNY